MKGSLAARFWAKVQKGSPESCWLWKGALSSPRGYGNLGGGPGGSTLKAHRVSWELANQQPVPNGLVVCHSCDNCACVNPAHLFVGTHKDNMQDCKSKGRQNLVPRDKKWNAKLSWHKVREIRNLLETLNNTEIGKLYGIDKSIISRIRTGSRWPESEDPLRAVAS